MRCAANVCCLDSDIRLRSHVEGESICHFLNELVKPDGEDRLRDHYGDSITDASINALQLIHANPHRLGWSGIIRALRRAAKTGSSIERAKALQRPAQAERVNENRTHGVEV